MNVAVINKIDSLIMPAIKDRNLTAPPASPSEGDRYLVATGGTGAWNGHDGDLALYYDEWIFLIPKEGWTFWVDDENIQIVFDGATWGSAGNTLNGLDDVTIAGVAQGDVLSYDSGSGDFINLTPALAGLMTTSGGTFGGDTGINAGVKLIFRDADIHIASLDDGHLDLVADAGIRLTTTGVTALSVPTNNVIEVGTELEIGQWPANVSFAHFGNADLDHSVVGNYALLQGNTGATYLNAASGQVLSLRIANSDLVVISGTDVKIGGAANYLSVEADGSQEWLGTATMWDDANLGAIILERGVSAPDIININGSTIRTPAFNGNATAEQLSGTLELPHSWKEASSITPHVHWMPTTANAGNVHWQFEYEVIGPGGTAGGGTIITVTTAAGGVAWDEIRSDFPAIAMAGKTVGTQIAFRVFRNPVDGADTYGDDAAMLTVGVHFEMDRPGSRQIVTK